MVMISVELTAPTTPKRNFHVSGKLPYVASAVHHLSPTHEDLDVEYIFDR